MINFLTKLLVGAFKLEARKFHKKAQVQSAASKHAADAAVRLARRSQEAVEDSRDLQQEARHNTDRAAHFISKSKAVESFFTGDVK